MINLSGNNAIARSAIGGKALHLDELIACGFRVPPTAVVLPDEPLENDHALRDWLGSVAGNEPWSLAVRSSADIEDTARESKAGHYLSVLGTMNVATLRDAMTRVRQSGPKMAVIVQPLLRPQIAGVLFSCDPVSYQRDVNSIAWTEGLADRLMAGDEPGTILTVPASFMGTHEGWPAGAELLQKLLQVARTLECRWDMPVDLEWVIDKQSVLWLVQARPVVLPQPAAIVLSSPEAFDQLPFIVRNHPKLQLRRQASVHHVEMAPASVYVAMGKPSRPADLDLFYRTAGVSVVLLHPERVEKRIVREFAPVRGSDVDFFTSTCRRYSIRRYPRASTLPSAIRTVESAGLEASWVTVSIVQALWAAHATGVIHRSSDAYILELALGHFVPKGIVPTSTVILSRNGYVISTTWAEQAVAFHFMDGHVIREIPPKEQLRLSDATVVRIARTFDPIFDQYEDAVLEFGLVPEEGELMPYLIDIAEHRTRDEALTTDLVTTGVLSPGLCRGRIARVTLGNANELDLHLHDQLPHASIATEGTVIVAERASVELLPFVSAPNVVGFIFERGSVLGHLAVVLREKGIPAIVIDAVEARALRAETIVEIDATSKPGTATERVRLVG